MAGLLIYFGIIVVFSTAISIAYMSYDATEKRSPDERKGD